MKPEETRKIKVTNEGREGIYLPDKESLKDWIVAQNFENIHHAFAGGRMVVGADWGVQDVLHLIDSCERIALLTGDNMKNNFGHSLAIVDKNGLNILDIGDVKEIIDLVL